MATEKDKTFRSWLHLRFYENIVNNGCHHALKTCSFSLTVIRWNVLITERKIFREVIISTSYAKGIANSRVAEKLGIH